VIAPAPVGGALVLIWLCGRRFDRPAVIGAMVLLPLLILVAPSRFEAAGTIAVEVPVVLALAGRAGVDRSRAAIACCFINLFTQPILYAAVRGATGPGAMFWWIAFATAEVVVAATEALLYLAVLADLRWSKGGVVKAAMISLAANATSGAAGLLLPI
jgi:hypothetical protein